MDFACGERMRQDHGEGAQHEQVTGAEQEIIGLIAEGLSNREIGHRLQIATHKIAIRVRRIAEKLGIRTRLEVAAYARRNGKARPRATVRPVADPEGPRG